MDGLLRLDKEVTCNDRQPEITHRHLPQLLSMLIIAITIMEERLFQNHTIVEGCNKQSAKMYKGYSCN